MYECDKCIPSHTKLLLASLQSRSATPLTTQQVAGFVCRPAYTKHAEPEMELRLDSVCCCMSLIKRFISSLWRYVEILLLGFRPWEWCYPSWIVFVKSGHLHFICQTLLAPLVFAFPPTSGAKKVRKEHAKQEQSASASSDSSVINAW